jgi:hypothetical protein
MALYRRVGQRDFAAYQSSPLDFRRDESGTIVDGLPFF